MNYNCEKCNFSCHYIGGWNKHINTEIHKTGQRKKRSDYKEPYKCEICDYITKNKNQLLQHTLNEHSNKEERKEKFKYYCELCDFGNVSKDLYNQHINTKKHKNKINNKDI
jgi:hypothetical protein